MSTNTNYNMRRFLFIWSLIVSMAFVGCSDNDDNDNNNISNPLPGTTWGMIDVSSGAISTLVFDDNECSYGSRYGGSSSDYKRALYSYTYKASKVTLIPFNDELTILEGIISGPVMFVKDASLGEDVGIFVKQ
jgi:hypothetical protein